ncbi:MAG: S9 family peptidase, partial [Terriglobales bacterium]
MIKPSRLLLAASVAAGSLAAQAVVKYQQPTAAILKVMEAPRPPRVLASPMRDYLLLLDAVPNPEIADLAQPMLRIAGIRIDPATNGLHATARVKDFRLQRIQDGSVRAIAFPAAIVHATAPFWSPDGRSFAFTNITSKGIQLWVGDSASAAIHQVPGIRLNAVLGAPCAFIAGSPDLLCKLIPAGRGPAPAADQVPVGPTVSESDGKAVPARTYEDLLKNPRDEDLFDYYATSQLARVNAASGAAVRIGRPAIFAEAALAPDGRHLLVARIHRPYSYLVPDSQFPRAYEVWSLAGVRERLLRDQPLGGERRPGFVDPEPRGWAWQPMQPATIMYEVALDGGNPNTKVPYRDRVMMLPAPFQGEGTEYLKTERRFAGISWGSAGDLAMLRDNERRQGTRTFFFDPRQPESMKLVWTLAPQNRYQDPGTPVAAFGKA